MDQEFKARLNQIRRERRADASARRARRPAAGMAEFRREICPEDLFPMPGWRGVVKMRRRCATGKGALEARR